MDTSKEYRNKEWLYNEYVNLEKPVKQIRRENGWGVNTIKRWLRKFNVPIRQLDNNIVRKQMSNNLSDHPNFGKRNRKTNGKYLLLHLPNHPTASKYGYVFEHRIVAEKIVDRILNDNEFVHHIDMDSKNNAIENLFVADKSGHIKAHASLNRLCKDLIEKGIIYFDKRDGVYGLLG